MYPTDSSRVSLKAGRKFNRSFPSLPLLTASLWIQDIGSSQELSRKECDDYHEKKQRGKKFFNPE